MVSLRCDVPLEFGLVLKVILQCWILLSQLLDSDRKMEKSLRFLSRYPFKVNVKLSLCH